MTQEDLIKFGITFLVGGVTSYITFKVLLPRLLSTSHPEGRLNNTYQLDKAKVAHSYDIEDLPDKVAYCRCWKSKKFPLCDGTHNAHNKLTGDNVGPVCLSRKN